MSRPRSKAWVERSRIIRPALAVHIPQPAAHGDLESDKRTLLWFIVAVGIMLSFLGGALFVAWSRAS